MSKTLSKFELACVESLPNYEKISKCAAKKIVCMLINPITESIISVGVNGTPSGYTNCEDIFFRNINGKMQPYDNNSYINHHEWSKQYEIHSEINAICKASRLGISTEGCTAIISYSPCFDCAKALISAGIKKIIYINEYDSCYEVSMFLEDNNIEIIQYESENEEELLLEPSIRLFTLYSRSNCFAVSSEAKHYFDSHNTLALEFSTDKVFNHEFTLQDNLNIIKENANKILYNTFAINTVIGFNKDTLEKRYGKHWIEISQNKSISDNILRNYFDYGIRHLKDTMINYIKSNFPENSEIKFNDIKSFHVMGYFKDNKMIINQYIPLLQKYPVTKHSIKVKRDN